MNILIVQDQGIGNMVMLTPAIRAIKEVCPEARIAVMGKPASLEVVDGWELVDEVVSGEREREGAGKRDKETRRGGDKERGRQGEGEENLKSQVSSLKSNFDICFLSVWSDEYAAKYGDWLWNSCGEIHKIERPKVWDRHEAEVNLEMARMLGYKGEMPETFCMSEDSLRILKTVVIADTITPGWEVKRYPYFRQLIKLFQEREYLPILVGGDREREEYEKNPLDGLFLECWDLPIPKLAGWISKCDLYIGNDSGPTHIAAAMGVPTVAIFGPTLTIKNRPLGKNVKIIRKNLPCVPCQYSQKWGKCRERACMNSISPADVMAIALDEYDPVEYWQERHDKYGMDMHGVGNASLIERDNVRMYMAAEKVIRSLITGREDLATEFHGRNQGSLSTESLAHKKVLDIGCGNGYYAWMYKKMGCEDYTGIDITDVLFPELRERFPEYTFGVADVTYKPSDETLEHWAGDLPGWQAGLTEAYLYDRWLIKCKVDIIQMLDVTQHITDDHRFFRAMENVKIALKPGGIFIVTDWLTDCKTYNAPYEVTRPMSYYQRAFEGYNISKPVRYRDKWAFRIQKKEPLIDANFANKEKG